MGCVGPEAPKPFSSGAGGLEQEWSPLAENTLRFTTPLVKRYIGQWRLIRTKFSKQPNGWSVWSERGQGQS